MIKILGIMMFAVFLRVKATSNQLAGEDVCGAKDVDSDTNNVDLLPPDCGTSKVGQNDVQGFKTADVMEFPWMAVLRYENFSDNFALCVGSLINTRYVLTTAWCTIAGQKPNQVRLGEHRFGQNRDCTEAGVECAPPVRDYGIECIIRHQNYSFVKYGGIKLTHNIALIRLDRDVTFEDHIRPICLPVTPSLRTFNPPQYFVTAWSVQLEGDVADPALIKLPVSVNASMCPHYFGNDSSPATLDSVLCMDIPDEEDIGGWSVGGPSGCRVEFSNEGRRMVQFGIRSFTKAEGALHTRVSFYMDWIMANMRP